MEFDAETGAISKSIPVTSDGKSSGLSGIPSVSKEVVAISSKMKVFSTWKTGDGSPASVLRVLPENNESFRGIILDELYNDKIANKVMVNLQEDLLQEDEFFLIERIFNKLKGLTSKAKNWLNNMYRKIIIRVKSALNKIKKMGAKLFEKLFEFFNIVITSVKENSNAYNAGLRSGMVILRVGQIEVDEIDVIENAFKMAKKQNRKALLMLVKVKNGKRFVAVEIPK